MLPSTRPTAALVLLLAILFVAPTESAAESAEHQQCSSCHLGQRPAPADALAAGARCAACHADVVQATAAHGSGNVGRAGLAPAAHVDCVDCHAPHGNGQPFQLKIASGDGASPKDEGLDDVTRLCTSCHSEHADTRGPRGHFIRHPVGLLLSADRRIAAERLGLPLVEQALSCISCHDVHGGAGTHGLRWSSNSESAVCRGCHAIDAPQGLFVARTGP